ncbi:MAG: hypothetical protein LBK95_12280 [Bifidobacteriaceae bacterium]|jgi:hypothetical protein|nr:hypothetical protein [Bifidobacteriaceae bacterium]
MNPRVGSILLDSQALSLVLDRDHRMMARLDNARRHAIPVVASILTVVEVARQTTDSPRLDWVLPRLHLVAEVTRTDGLTALSLSRAADLSGQEPTVDPLVAALALRLPSPTVVYTSDPRGWRLLVGRRVGIVQI